MMRVVLALGLMALAGCQGLPQQPPKLETGITSSNGGGTREVGTNPNVGVTTVVK